ncbi:IclR family transcriptional regulator [Microbacterium murale]|uniref:IclR family transcriptional regulator n=1 Tax=Microbacterium murale TaxID=1081040 RepID=A0ABQ1RIM0_9MICO|nr:IclR family transcriptional regulator [Microbacterium murale]GGD69531.1 IclR family transcriptional regulator [Microbacterium murale]
MASTTVTETAPTSVKSALRTVELLELLASSPRPMSLAEVHRELPYPKSSLLVLLRTLVGRGWLQFEPGAGRYSIGLRALLAGSSYLERDLVAQFSGPLLRRLGEELDETVHVARLDGSDVIYLASRESTHHLRSTSRVGRRLPANACSLGKALLSARSDDVVDALLPKELESRTPHTLADRPSLFADLAKTRERGWAREIGENTPGLACVAVAIPHGGSAVDAISCSIPIEKFDPEVEARVVSALRATAAELSGLVDLASGADNAS